MTGEHDPAGPRPDLERRLAEAREADALPAGVELDAMLGEVERSLREADGSWLFRVRSLATGARRAIALGAAATVVALGASVGLRADLASAPVGYLAVGVVAGAALLAVCLTLALRPLCAPPLPRGLRGALAAVSLAATAALALLTPAGAVAGREGLVEHATPCAAYGLLLGLPVYAVLRVLDRGGAGAALVASCAAGLTGHLVLTLHCPRTDPAHLMAGHFAVVLLFVAVVGGLPALWDRRAR
ncbi:MAG: DUF1109 family protein [Sandaracinaceae bacterium]|nr:DUF1109 family protein [Sandaracinaceae bacterium]